MRAIALLPLYCASVLAPVILSWVSNGPPRSFRDEIASGLGLLAFAMILVEFVLSGRFRSVSGGIGLDTTIRFHQLMARVALGFALAHPFLYQTLSNPPRPDDVTRHLTLTADFGALWSGIAAFVLLPAFVLMSIARSYLPYRYEAWRLMHGLGALLIAGLLWHHATAAGRYSAAPQMVWIWSAMLAVATLSLVFVYLVKPLAQLRRPWRVTARDPLGPRLWRLRIAPRGHDWLSFKAGQFVWLNVGHSPFSLNENPFSISSAPGDGPELDFIIKELGDFTNRIGDIAIGTAAHLDGPHGTLHIEGRAEPGIALIAGGVGIAPMLGILRTLERADDPRPRLLVYGNRIADQIVFPDDLDRYVASGRTTVHHVLSEPPKGWRGATGRIDAALVGRQFSPEQLAQWLFVLCGPPAMMTTVEDALLARGVAPARILSERFQYD